MPHSFWGKNNPWWSLNLPIWYWTEVAWNKSRIICVRNSIWKQQLVTPHSLSLELKVLIFWDLVPCFRVPCWILYQELAMWTQCCKGCPWLNGRQVSCTSYPLPQYAVQPCAPHPIPPHTQRHCGCHSLHIKTLGLQLFWYKHCWYCQHACSHTTKGPANPMSKKICIDRSFWLCAGHALNKTKNGACRCKGVWRLWIGF